MYQVYWTILGNINYSEIRKNHLLIYTEFIALNSKQQEITQNLKLGLKVIKTQKCGCPSGHISQEILVARHKFLVALGHQQAILRVLMSAQKNSYTIILIQYR